MQESVIQALSLCIQANIPVAVWGDPGIGKSKTVEAIARALGRPLEILILSQREPSDLLGLPIPTDEGDVIFAPPRQGRRLQGVHGILFLDEANDPRPGMQAAAMRVVLDREMGDLKLPESTAIVLAMNPPEHSAGGGELALPLANRMLHLEASVDPRAWCEGIKSGFPTPRIPLLPLGWERDKLQGARALVSQFVGLHPNLLMADLKKLRESGKPVRGWQSPRSWDMAARALAAASAMQASNEVTTQLFHGALGAEATMAFMGWASDPGLPVVDRVLGDPIEALKGLDDAKAHRVLESVIDDVARRLSADRWQAFWRVLDTVAAAGRADTAVRHAQEMLGRPEVKDPAGKLRMAIPAAAVKHLGPALQAAGLL